MKALQKKDSEKKSAVLYARIKPSDKEFIETLCDNLGKSVAEFITDLIDDIREQKKHTRKKAKSA